MVIGVENVQKEENKIKNTTNTEKHNMKEQRERDNDGERHDYTLYTYNISKNLQHL